MHMNVSAAIVPVHVRTDQSLMSRKVCFCIFHSKLLCPFSRQTIFCTIPWIKADNVMVAFDFILIFVFLVFTVQLLAGRIERIRFTVQTVQTLRGVFKPGLLKIQRKFIFPTFPSTYNNLKWVFGIQIFKFC